MSSSTTSLDEILRKMERYCRYQERCRKEVLQKLVKYNLSAGQKEQVLDQLQLHGFLNERRFARAYAQGKFSVKKWGRKRIRYELQQRQISGKDIRSAIEEIDEEAYREAFHHLAARRFEQLHDADPLKRMRKLSDYLLYRGWEDHMVYEKVRELTKGNSRG